MFRVLWVDSVGRDLNYAVRSLTRAPGFTIVCLLVLALGIGANAAIFSIVDALLLCPLPFPDAARLVRIDGIVTRLPLRMGETGLEPSVDTQNRPLIDTSKPAIN